MVRFKKKKGLAVAGACLITATFCIGTNGNIAKSNEGESMYLSNVTALAQGEGGSSAEWRCVESYSGCLIFGCSYVDKCGAPCHEVKTDVIDYSGKCVPN